MQNLTTGAMREFGSGPDEPGAGALAGLVLLYADEYEALPPAFVLDAPKRIIGRDESADYRLGPVNAVSRVHAELFWEAGAWRVRDLGSRNGTLIDGRRVEEAELEAISEVRVGDAIFKFVERDAEHYAGYRIDGTLIDRERRCRAGTTLVGGYQIDRIAAEIERIAPTQLSVMVLGESGTGKEEAARELHRLSGRRGSFCAVNCAAIPASLIESELFGYKRGAFSGADRDKPGLIRSADGGTLLLDEIGDMPLEAQAKLLRVLQSKEVFPLGATSAERVDVRIVCATHRELGKLIQNGSFRADLFARLNEYQLRIVPLRERKEDTLVLLRAFLARHGRPDLQPSFAFMTALLEYDWPYNVRELEACIKRCIALADGPMLVEEQLPDAVRDAMEGYGEPAGPEVRTPGRTRPSVTPPPTRVPSDEELRSLLTRHHGNVAAVGRELGKARMQVHRWMKRYGIEVADYRSGES
jgi:DNA-binding NtrC family response regulator